MTAQITQFNSIVSKVEMFCNRLGIDMLEDKKKGRKLAIPVAEILGLAVFKQTNAIPTKKALYLIFEPDCSYKTLVVNLNRFSGLGLLMVSLMLNEAVCSMRQNRQRLVFWLKNAHNN